MKKALSFILACALLLCLFGCGQKYKPQESTKEEATTVYTLIFENETYEVKYELYRAFFLNFRSQVDGGDSSVWTSENKDEYIEKIDRIILDLVTDIYASFAVCKKIGFDIYSKEVNKTIEEYITVSIEGGTLGDYTVLGMGSYEDYLQSLKEDNLNYSAQVLLYRYAIATDAIDEYYIGTISADEIDSDFTVGAIKYTRDDVREFYDSDSCVRVLRHFIQAGMHDDNYVSRVRGYIADAAKDGESAVALTMKQNSSLSTYDEIKNGYVMGRYNLDRAVYKEMTDAAFLLDIGEVSNAIEVKDGYSDGYYILYRAEKSDEHFEECYSSICYIFLKDKTGEIIEEARVALLESAVASDFLKSLDRSKISM